MAVGGGRDLVFTILGIDRGSQAFDKLSASADRSAKRLDAVGKTTSAVLLGTTGAAAAAGVGIAATLGGTALLFGALGIAAVASNERVANSFADLSADIKRGTQDAAAPLVPVMVETAEQFGRTFDELQPRLRGLFTDSIPAIRSTVDGVTGLAVEALPGLERAVKASGPPMAAVKSLMIDTGQGATAFFTAVSKGSESSGQIIRVFGVVIRETLGVTGNLLASLSNQGAPTVERLGQAFTQTLHVVEQLATGGFPVLFGAVGVGLNMLSGLLSIVGALSGALGPLAGVVTATGLALKLLDTISFGAVSVEFARVKDAMDGVSGAKDKLKTGMTGLASGLVPLIAGAGLLGVALYGLGKAQEQAAQEAAAHQQRVNSLANALRDSNGALNDNVRALAAKSLSEAQVGRTGKTVLEVARESGISLSQLTDAYLGNADAQAAVNRQLDDFLSKRSLGAEADAAAGIDEMAARAGELKQLLPGLNGEYATSAQKAKDVASAQGLAADATGNHSAALVRLHEALLGFVSKDLAYRQAVHSEREAHDQVAEAINKHTEAKQRATDAVNRYGAGSQAAKDAIAAEKDAQDALTGALLGWEGNIQGAVARAGDLAAANYRGSDASEAQRLKMEGANKEIIRLAQLSGQDAPASLRALILGMDTASLSALGVTVRVNETGAAVYRLPNGKEITIHAEDAEARRKLEELERIQIRDKFFNVIATQIDRVRNPSDPNAYAPGRAEGGPVQAWTPYLVGERGPELLITGQPGHIYDATSTRRMFAGSGGGMGGGPGLGERHYHLTVVNANNSVADLRAQFERLENMDFPEG